MNKELTIEKICATDDSRELHLLNYLSWEWLGKHNAWPQIVSRAKEFAQRIKDVDPLDPKQVSKYTWFWDFKWMKTSFSYKLRFNFRPEFIRKNEIKIQIFLILPNNEDRGIDIEICHPIILSFNNDGSFDLKGTPVIGPFQYAIEEACLELLGILGIDNSNDKFLNFFDNEEFEL